MPERTVAVVIPALDEADNIDALLEDCAAQTLPPSEVIVVDAGSTDGTWELLRARAAERPWLRVLRVPGATPGAGRNAGAEQASSELIATVDAGTRLDPDWLERLTAPASAADGVVAVGTSVPDARSEFERAAGWFTLRAFKPPDRPGPVSAEFLPAGRNGYCFSREAWRRAGGYPPELPWGEDKTFVRRLRAGGAEVVVAPGAVVRWRPRRSLAEFYRQYRNYGRGDAMARIDRRNTLIPAALYGAGALLGLRAGSGGRLAGGALAAGATAYAGLFTAAAARQLGLSRALAWVPVLRVAADLAKMHGFVAAYLRKI